VKLRALKVVATTVPMALVGSLTASCGFADPSPFGTVQDFLIAWQVENYTAAARHTTGVDEASVAKQLSSVESQLDAASLRLNINDSRIVKSGDGYDAQFNVKIDLGENGDPWTYKSSMHLVRKGNSWRIQWKPSVIYPLLTDGSRLAVVTQPQKRAQILDATGKPLLATVKADVYGVYPGLLSDPATTLTQLAKLTNMPADRLIARVAAAPPRDFLPLLTLQSGGDSARLAGQLQRIKGVSFQRNQTIKPARAAEFIGDLGPATADRLQQVGAPYQPGDTIGVSGLQLYFQRQLASIPEVDVVVLDPQGHAQVIKSSDTKDTAPPEEVRTTLDSATQRKAEQALKNLKVPASLVALRPSTGDVLAVANHSTGGEDRALTAKYAPGLTYGIVTAGALLKRGQQLGQRLDCPATTTAGGQAIANTGVVGKATSGPFETDVARGCATTLAALSTTLDAQTLTQAATDFGLGRDLGLSPVPVFSGSVPAVGSDAAKAQQMVGQGDVKVSPLSMAAIAGAVSTGTWRPPRLVQGSVAAAGSVDQTPPQPQLLDPSMVGGLESLLHKSASVGSAKAAGLPGLAVNGLAAQADQGQGKTVSWFVGYRDGVAFALAIEGKENAAAIAAKFLKAK
jgi:cell division protein FtsI/penicillin-binding protein 2